MTNPNEIQKFKDGVIVASLISFHVLHKNSLQGAAAKMIAMEMLAADETPCPEGFLKNRKGSAEKG